MQQSLKQKGCLFTFTDDLLNQSISHLVDHLTLYQPYDSFSQKAQEGWLSAPHGMQSQQLLWSQEPRLHLLHELDASAILLHSNLKVLFAFSERQSRSKLQAV